MIPGVHMDCAHALNIVNIQLKIVNIFVKVQCFELQFSNISIDVNNFIIQQLVDEVLR